MIGSTWWPKLRGRLVDRDGREFLGREREREGEREREWRESGFAWLMEGYTTDNK